MFCMPGMIEEMGNERWKVWKEAWQEQIEYRIKVNSQRTTKRAAGQAGGQAVWRGSWEFLDHKVLAGGPQCAEPAVVHHLSTFEQPDYDALWTPPRLPAP